MDDVRIEVLFELKSEKLFFTNVSLKSEKVELTTIN